ncbi:hypothetical protein BDB00DRAFT_820674 [Zychaea mexicana]|uniref:uncharacterized protein n=1 Tax=Zychaea mexicana TaxID=64656 RepID=UPI0022FDC6EA|nr:uncharacterized protein BDB00DRAFT_820674 [Zychaea mexicana]KAI9494050.1 hypothetical protein BDB00DRAFT_820674 [Zychaea mexicana]
MNDSVSILVAVFLILVALRWMLGGSQQLPGQQAGQRRAPTRRPQHRATPQMVEMVRTVFPNIPIAAIVADLQRTGSVETTIDNALRDGGLPLPPPTTPPSPPSTAGNANGSSSSSTGVQKSNYSDLMMRYKIKNDSQDSVGEQVEEPPKVWEASPDKRQETLRKRKEFMVLQARRKMLEKQKPKEPEAASSSSVVPEVGKPEEEEASGYDEMSVEQLNSLSPEERRRHLLEAVERRAPSQ